MKVAVDLMGGDEAPQLICDALDLFVATSPSDVEFVLFGTQEALDKVSKDVQQKSTLVPCQEVISNFIKPLIALRGMHDSSLRKAIMSVAEGQTQGVVSAGNTGAYMALSKVILGTLPGIDRPAIPSFLPTLKHDVLMLDLGANVECSAKHLFQFALMGRILAKQYLGKEEPCIGLLNIGHEAGKGNDTLNEAFSMLKNYPGFIGFVEGTDISKGEVDVIVTDGFSGNIALKTLEGTVNFISLLLKQSIKKSWLSKLGYLLARNNVQSLRTKLDPRLYNGAIFLGLNGIAVKSHGGTDSLGFANALGVCVRAVRRELIADLKEEFAASTFTSNHG